jgi:hypothetical protein
MIDAMMAICITAIGVLSLLSFMPQGWSSSRSSDSRGRAAMIMHREFENMQALIENKCNPTPTAATPYTKTVNSSGQGTAITGDQSFTVNKTIPPVAGKNNAWTDTVQVIWPGTTTGVRDSHQIVQQDDYAFPVVAGTPNCSSNPTVSFN